MKQHNHRILIVLVILAVPLTIISGLLINNVQLPSEIRPLAWPLLIGITVVLTSVTVLQLFLDRNPEQHESKRKSQNRESFLAKVDAFWIKSILEQSLHGVALIALGLRERPDAVRNPWRLTHRSPDSPEHLLPDGTQIVDVFNNNNSSGELLILGEPGSGKTTLLLELTRNLLDLSRKDETYPMPVVFNLSSWAEKRQPLVRWLVEELNSKYLVPPQLGQSWVENDELLLLLDGLDEVSMDFRPACIEAINAYRRQHGLVPIVVCCRNNEYLTLSTRLLLQKAIVIQPLTTQQINAYLANAGEQLASIRLALLNDTALQDLVTTPLMLDVLTLTYQGKSIKEFPRGDPTTIRNQVFEAYIQRMIQQRDTTHHYTPRQTVHWLSWLARQLIKHEQTQFFIERIQPNWLPEGKLRRLYRGLVTRMVDGVTFGIIGGVVYRLLFGLFGDKMTIALLLGIVCVLIGKLDTETKPLEMFFLPWLNKPRSFKNRIAVGTILGLVVGIITGLVIGFLYGGQKGIIVGVIVGLIIDLAYLLVSSILKGMFERNTRLGEVAWSQESIRSSLGDAAIFGLLVGLLFCLSGGLTIGLLFGISCGLIYGLVSMLSNGLKFAHVEIKSVEVVAWSWMNMRQNLVKNLATGLIIGLGAGLIIGLIVGLVVGPAIGLFIGLVIGLVIGLDAGLVRWLGSGWSKEVLDEREIIKPNQGIWYSLRNAILTGSLAVPLIGLVTGSATGLIFGPKIGLQFGLITGLVFGIVVGFERGGRAWVNHFILRVLLWRTGQVPLNYSRFLDYAVEHILLRRVGGGYIFIHRLLLEYFASL